MNDFPISEIESALEQSSGILGDIESILGSIAGIFSFATMGISAVFAIIAVVFAGLVAIVYFVFESIPVYTLAKRVGYKYAWLAWMPFFHDYCRIFVLCETAGNKPFDANISKIKLENRKMSFLAHILIKYFGGAIISTVVAIVSTILPVVGSLSFVLGFVPAAACAVIEYVYLRDLLDIYKEDKKANNTAAIVVSVIEFVLVGDLIRTCYLYTLIKKQPLPVKEVVMDENVATEFVTVSDDAPAN